MARTALARRRMGGMVLGSAAVLGALAAAVEVGARAAERSHLPLGRFLNVDGVYLHYVDRGQGRPVVLLHGIGSMIEDFAAGLIGPLRQRYRALAFDRPGHGHSTRPGDRSWTPETQARLLLSALARLGVHQPVVLGHGLGALVALAMAEGAQERLAGLVLVGGYFYPTSRRDVLFWQLPGMPAVGPLMTRTIWPVLANMAGPGVLRRLFAPEPVPAGFLERFPMALARRPGQLHAAGEDLRLMEPAAARLARGYSALTLPVVIVAGDADQVNDPRWHSVQLHHELPQSVLHMVAGAGHMVHHSEPEGIMASLDACWQRHDAQADLTSRPSLR